MSEPAGSSRPPRLRVGFVPGVTLTKWRRVWGERFPRNTLEVLEVPTGQQREVLDTKRVDACFVRLPIDRTGLHLIPLYEEVAVVMVPRDHPAALYDAVTLADLADESDIDPEHPDAIDLVVGGAGVLRVPQSVARTHSRRDLVHRPVSDAPSTTIGLAWPMDDPHELVESFIGVVRGRTVHSSRTRTTTEPPATPPKPARAPKPPASGRSGVRGRRGGRPRGR